MIQRASRLCSMLVSLMAASVHAQATAGSPVVQLAPPQDERAGLSATAFWFGASATIITASLGGFYALRVRDLYDEAQGTPSVSPERNLLHDRMVRAERTADILFVSALALATATTFLAFRVDWSSPPARTRAPIARSLSGRWSLAPVILPGVQSLQLRGALP